jgi:hypothetical protein
MRPALMLLAVTGLVILVLVRLRVERPDLIMTARQRGPEAPAQFMARQEIIGGPTEPQVRPAVETELERLQRQRALYQQLYPHLGEAMQLDAKTESALYDLLARQGLDFRGGENDPPEIQDQVAAEKDAALEQLLGEHTFRRFDEYRQMPATGDVGRLNAKLGEAQRIRGEAIYRLTRLIHENSIYGSKDPQFVPSFQTLPPEVEGSLRSQALIMLAKQEDSARTSDRWSNRIELEAASFLTPVQLDALKRSHAETRERWLRGIEHLRAEIGSTPGIIRRRIPMEGNIRTQLTVTVNDEPVRFEHTGSNRERFGFKAGSGLRVEAIPTLYDDGWLDLLLAYSETRRGKPRQLDQWVIVSCPTRQPNGAPSAAHDSIMETHQGLMEYRIRPTGIAVTALDRQ